MFIVKRKCAADGDPFLPDGSEVDATIGVVDDLEDGMKLLVCLQHDINNDDSITRLDWTADIDETHGNPVLSIHSVYEDDGPEWFTVELEPVVWIDHDTINNRLSKALDNEGK